MRPEPVSDQQAPARDMYINAQETRRARCKWQ